MIPALGHTLMHHAAQAPTYTQIGWDAYDTCAYCDYSTYVELPMRTREPIALGTTDLQLGAGETVRMLFTAEEDGLYAFTSLSDSDTYGYLYDADDALLIKYDDQSGSGNNFLMEYAMTQGQTVCLRVKYYYSSMSGTIPVRISKVNTVDGGEVALGDNEIAVPADSRADYSFTAFADGLYSFTLSDNNSIAILNSSGQNLSSSNYGSVYELALTADQQVTVRVTASDSERKAALNISYLKGRLSSVAGVCVDGAPLTVNYNPNSISAYKPFTVTFDPVENAEYYEINLNGATYRVEADQRSYTFSLNSSASNYYMYIYAYADQYARSSAAYVLNAVVREEDTPDLELAASAEYVYPGTIVSFTANAVLPATLHCSESGLTTAMVNIDGVTTGRMTRDYGSSENVFFWVTDAENHYSNLVAVRWSYDAEPEAHGEASKMLTEITVNGQNAFDNPVVSAGELLKFQCNPVEGAEYYNIYFSDSTQEFSYQLQDNAKIFLKEGIYTVNVKARDEYGEDIARSDSITLTVTEEADPALEIAASAEECWLSENVTFTNNNDVPVYLVYERPNGNLSSYSTIRAHYSITVSYSEPGDYTYRFADYYGRVSAPFVITAKSHGQLPAPEISLNGSVLPEMSVVPLASGDVLNFAASAGENAQRYSYSIWRTDSEGSTYYTYGGDASPNYTYTMQEDTARLSVEVDARADGWESSSTTAWIYVVDGSVYEDDAPEIELTADKDYARPNTAISFTANAALPATLHSSDRELTSAMIDLNGVATARVTRDYGSSEEVFFWVTDAENHYSNPVAVRWDYDAEPGEQGEASTELTEITVNRQNVFENPVVSAGALLQFEYNPVENADSYLLEFISRVDMDSYYLHESEDIFLDAGVYTAYISVRDNDWNTLCCSDNFTLTVTEETAPALEITASAEECWLGEDITFTNNNDVPVILVYKEPNYNRLYTYTTIRPHQSTSSTVNDPGTYSYRFADYYGRTSAPVEITAKSRGKLAAPEVSLNGQILSSTGFATLTPGTVLDFSASGDENTQRYGFEIEWEDEEESTHYSSSGSSYGESPDFSYTVREGTVILYVNVSTYADGWESGHTRVKVCGGAHAPEFTEISVNGSAYAKDMMCYVPSELRIGWNYIDGADSYRLRYGNTPDFSENAERNDTERNYESFSINSCDRSERVYFKISAYDELGRWLVSSPVMRLSISERQEEGAFTLTADNTEIIAGDTINFEMSREARLYKFNDDYGFWADEINWEPQTHITYSMDDREETMHFFARDEDGQYSNVVTVNASHIGRLPVPDVLLNGEPIENYSYEGTLALTPGEECVLEFSAADAPEGMVFKGFVNPWNDRGGDDFSFKTDDKFTFVMPEDTTGCYIEFYPYLRGWRGEQNGYEMCIDVGGGDSGTICVDGTPVSEVHDLPRNRYIELTWDRIANAQEYELKTGEERSWGYRSGYARYLPEQAGEKTFELIAYDRNGNVLASETFTLNFVVSEDEPTLTADRTSVFGDDTVQLTASKPIIEVEVEYNRGLDGWSRYFEEERVTQVFDFDNDSGIFGECTFRGITEDGWVTNAVRVNRLNSGALGKFVPLINGATPGTVSLKPGDVMHFTIPDLENVTDFSLWYGFIVDGDYNEMWYYGKELIERQNIVIPENVEQINFSVRAMAEDYEASEYSSTIYCGMEQITGVKIDGVAAANAKPIAHKPCKITWNAVSGATRYTVLPSLLNYSDMTGSTSYTPLTKPEQYVAFVENETTITLRAYDGSRMIASTTIAINVQPPQPAFELTLTQGDPYGGSDQALSFAASGASGSVQLYVYSPKDYPNSRILPDTMTDLCLKEIVDSECLVWAVDEQNRASNAISFRFGSGVRIRDHFALTGSAAAGGSAGVTFDELPEALRYRLTVNAETADGRKLHLCDASGTYAEILATAFDIPLCARSISVSLAAFDAVNTVDEAELSGEISGDTPMFTLPASIKTVEESAFENISAQIVLLPEGLETVEAYAFANSAVREMLVPSSVLSMADNAFSGCSDVRIFRERDGVYSLD